jgi:hypothetical protein
MPFWQILVVLRDVVAPQAIAAQSVTVCSFANAACLACRHFSPRTAVRKTTSCAILDRHITDGVARAVHFGLADGTPRPRSSPLP